MVHHYKYCQWWGVCVTNNNGFWIRVLVSLVLNYNYNRLRQLTINDCLRHVPVFTGLRVSSIPLCPPPYQQVKFKVTLRLTVSKPIILGVEPHLALMTRYLLFLTLAILLFWGALSDESTGLSCVYVAGPWQRNPSRVRVPWDSWPYFTVSDLRLPFSSTPTTRRITVDVFDPASTRCLLIIPTCPPFITSEDPDRDHHLEQLVVIPSVVTETGLQNRSEAKDSLVVIRCNEKVITNCCWAMDVRSCSSIIPLPSNGHIRLTTLSLQITVVTVCRGTTCLAINENLPQSIFIGFIFFQNQQRIFSCTPTAVNISSYNGGSVYIL
jgi:hypothetical protein